MPDEPLAPPAQELAQKILSWIERTRGEIQDVSESSVHGYLITLVDDIERLCKERLEQKEEPNAR